MVKLPIAGVTSDPGDMASRGPVECPTAASEFVRAPDVVSRSTLRLRNGLLLPIPVVASAGRLDLMGRGEFGSGGGSRLGLP
jgi:hypothetical protein